MDIIGTTLSLAVIIAIILMVDLYEANASKKKRESIIEKIINAFSKKKEKTKKKRR